MLFSISCRKVTECSLRLDRVLKVRVPSRFVLFDLVFWFGELFLVAHLVGFTFVGGALSVCFSFFCVFCSVFFFVFVSCFFCFICLC